MANQSLFKKILRSRPFLFLVLIFFIWVAISVVKVSYKKYLLHQEVQKLQEQLANIQNQNARLAEYLQYLQSDSFAEKEAKDKLNMKKEGEEVIVVPELKENLASAGANLAPGSSALAEDKTPPAKSFWWKWWSYFFE